MPRDARRALVKVAAAVVDAPDAIVRAQLSRRHCESSPRTAVVVVVYSHYKHAKAVVRHRRRRKIV